jgi:predicted enzyme related to lactoylglutathione lyase
MNLCSYFEIPVRDLARAMDFYQTVFGHAFECASVDGNRMAFFPHSPHQPGASGALAQGESYVPSGAGVRIYFDVDDIQATLARAVAAGG